MRVPWWYIGNGVITMRDLEAIAADVKADVRNAIDSGKLTIPGCVAVNIRTTTRETIHSVNAYLSPARDHTRDAVNAWKYTTSPDGTKALSAAIIALGIAIVKMIKHRSNGSCYGEVNCTGTIVAILIPTR